MLLALVAGLVELVALYAVYRVTYELTAGTASRGALVGLAAVNGGAVLERQLSFTLASAISHAAAYKIQCALRLRMTERLARLPMVTSSASPAVRPST